MNICIHYEQISYIVDVDTTKKRVAYFAAADLALRTLTYDTLVKNDQQTPTRICNHPQNLKTSTMDELKLHRPVPNP